MAPKKKSSWFAGLVAGEHEEDSSPWSPNEALVRSKFEHYDTNNSGTLDESEVMALAQDIWIEFNPKVQPLDFMQVKELSQELMQSIAEKNGGDAAAAGLVTFDQFFPWYKIVADQHYRMTQMAREEPINQQKASPSRTQRSAPGPAPTDKSPTNATSLDNHEGLLPKLQALKDQVSEIRKSLKGWDEEFADELEKCIQELPSMDSSAV